MLRSEGSQWDGSQKAAENARSAGKAAADPAGGRSAQWESSQQQNMQTDPLHFQMEGRSPVALAKMVEGEIIPRLLMHCRSQGPVTPLPRPTPHLSDGKIIEMLASSAIEEDARQLLAQVEAQLARGTSTESMLVDMLAPAARLLGEWWEQDVCDFIDVTMGLWRLQEVVHDIAGRAGAADRQTGPTRAGNRRTALFCVFPGDDHSFGSLVVEELFRAAGWASQGARSDSRDALLAHVRDQWFDLVAITAGSGLEMASMADLIAALRRSSCNPDLLIMVGGWIFNQDATLVKKVGADGSAPDARAAVRLADALMQGGFVEPATDTGAA